MIGKDNKKELKEKIFNLMSKLKKLETENESKPKVQDVESKPKVQEHQGTISKTILEPIREVDQKHTYDSSTSFEQFVDERILVSHDALGTKEMKIKVLEVSDEIPPVRWKFGDRVKVNKILITIKHLKTQQIEEGELDIEQVEKEIREKRHYSSTNRWIPVTDIKNGYVVGSRHTSLISDAVALDYITF